VHGDGGEAEDGLEADGTVVREAIYPIRLIRQTQTREDQNLRWVRPMVPGPRPVQGRLRQTEPNRACVRESPRFGPSFCADSAQRPATLLCCTRCCCCCHLAGLLAAQFGRRLTTDCA
jgi:hypothetical protein